MHRLHHSDIKRETDSNYSSIFSLWDRIFFSFTMRPIDNNFQLGLGERFAQQPWNKLAGIISIPFRTSS